MNEHKVDPLLELLLELGARAKQAERTVAAQQAYINELEEKMAALEKPEEVK